MDHSWLLVMNHICKKKKPCLALPKCRAVVAVKGYYKGCFFNVHQSLWSPKVIRILIIMKIISFTLKQSGWVPSYTKVVVCFSTIAQQFPIYNKFLAIILSMQNHPHLIILNQKINTNTKLPMSLTQLVL